jgi:outer membrane immunogenic protein
MKPVKPLLALLALASLAGAAHAQDVIATVQNPWEGFFAGANIGGAWNHTCSSWTPGPGITDNPTLANAFYNRDCPSNGNFIGGVDFGYNFQFDQWVWGIKADYEAIGSKNKTVVYNYTSRGPLDPFPTGTYTASGKISPNGIFLLGPRVGYSFDQAFPYFRVGGAFSGGQHTSTLSYTPPGATAPSDSFSGGKNYKSHGFNAGVGFDYGIVGPWSFNAEYNYVNLGKGTNSTFTCTGASAAFCNTYSNFSLDNIHNSFTMNLFRVGFHYSFK